MVVDARRNETTRSFSPGRPPRTGQASPRTVWNAEISHEMIGARTLLPCCLYRSTWGSHQRRMKECSSSSWWAARTYQLRQAGVVVGRGEGHGEEGEPGRGAAQEEQGRRQPHTTPCGCACCSRPRHRHARAITCVHDGRAAASASTGTGTETATAPAGRPESRVVGGVAAANWSINQEGKGWIDRASSSTMRRMDAEAERNEMEITYTYLSQQQDRPSRSSSSLRTNSLPPLSKDWLQVSIVCRLPWN